MHVQYIIEVSRTRTIKTHISLYVNPSPESKGIWSLMKMYGDQCICEFVDGGYKVVSNKYECLPWEDLKK